MATSEELNDALKKFWDSYSPEEWGIKTEFLTDDLLQATISHKDRVVVTAYALRGHGKSAVTVEEEGMLKAINRLPSEIKTFSSASVSIS